MTDTVDITLSLSKIHHKALADLPKPSRTDKDNTGQPIRTTPRLVPSRNSLSGAGFMYKVEPVDAPQRISATINAPTLSTGQNAVHGLSVSAATQVGLYTLQCELLAHRVPLEEVQKLTLEDITLGDTTLTYLLVCADAGEAKDSLKLLGDSLGALHGVSPRATSKSASSAFNEASDGNAQTYYHHKPDRTLSVRMYIKTKDVADRFVPFSSRTIRLELIVKSAQLKKLRDMQHTATSPLYWSDAHAAGKYQTIFDTLVKNTVFRLDEKLRHMKPDHTDLEKLTGLPRKIVDGWLNNLDPRSAKEFADLRRLGKAREETRLFSDVKREIQAKLRIDITIPREKHNQIKRDKVKNVLELWKGDLALSKNYVDHSFCKRNWEELISRYQTKIEGMAETYAPVANKPSNPEVDQEIDPKRHW